MFNFFMAARPERMETMKPVFYTSITMDACVEESRLHKIAQNLGYVLTRFEGYHSYTPEALENRRLVNEILDAFATHLGWDEVYTDIETTAPGGRVLEEDEALAMVRRVTGTPA